MKRLSSPTDAAPGGVLTLADDLRLSRMGYGAMQLAGPNAFGPPRDRAEAIRVLRAAVELGITHIDTSGFYGPGVVNDLIAEALHPYQGDLRIATKVGRIRDHAGNWIPELGPSELVEAVHEDLRHLRLDRLDLVHLRLRNADPNGSIEEPFSALAQLRAKGLIAHLGLSGASQRQLDQARAIAPVVAVQNLYNLGNRQDQPMVDRCAREGIAYTSFFPLRGGASDNVPARERIARRYAISATQVTLAWLLQCSPTMLLIPGTSQVSHLRQNVASAVDVVLTDADTHELASSR